MPFTEFKGLKLPTHKTPSPFLFTPTTSPPTTQGLAAPEEKRQENTNQHCQSPLQMPAEPLQSAMKGKGERSQARKQVHWSPEVVDNENKKQPSATQPKINPSMDTVHPSKSSSPSRKSPSTVSEKSANAPTKRSHSHHHQSHTANTSAIRKSPPPRMIHEAASRHLPHAGSKPTGHHEILNPQPRIPHTAPDPPQQETRTPSPSLIRRLRKPDLTRREAQASPPTPRPQRLPTPDLPEIGCGLFCECCKNQAPYLDSYHSLMPRGYYGTPPKWEFQLENAIAYIKGGKKH